jgi:hypothetical protein
MLRTTGGITLHGDWRRRRGSQTDAHLYGKNDFETALLDTRRPMCSMAIPRRVTAPVSQGQPCRDCLIAAITRRSSAQDHLNR